MTWATKLAGVTLVQERLDEAKAFYTEVFELQAAFEDESKAVFKIGETIIHLLEAGAAPDLIGPGAVAAPSTGHRVQLAIQVDDVDGLCRQLESRRVRILSGPMDRPWGIRTANFEDPGATAGRCGRIYREAPRPTSRSAALVAAKRRLAHTRWDTFNQVVSDRGDRSVAVDALAREPFDCDDRAANHVLDVPMSTRTKAGRASLAGEASNLRDLEARLR